MGKKIGIIGRIDPQGAMFDGQTVKTRTIYRLLKDKFGDDIVAVDTLDYKKRAPQTFFSLIRGLFMCDDVFVLLSRGGRTALFPIISVFAKLRGVRVYHSLIGGWLGRDISQDKSGKLVKQLNSFAVNWVETNELVEELKEFGVGNACYLPNFKQLRGIEVKPEYHFDEPYAFCAFSRVQKKKGIENAIAAIESINSGRSVHRARLDIYGPIDDDYDDEFKQLVAKSSGVAYCGCVSPEESVAIIKDYYCLLFPTEWLMEGIPGTIIDAMSAGVPVIASRWRYYSEMLEDGITGFSYPFECVEGLEPAINQMIDLSDSEVASMKRAIRKRADLYSPEIAFASMLSAMEAAQ